MGLRRPLLTQLLEMQPPEVGFYEIAPENWINIGGKYGREFRAMTERRDFICHGLSLSLGSTDPLDEDFVRAVKRFMAEHGMKLYSEHLSYCSNGGHLYDLMPIPFTEDAMKHVAARIRQVQDMLGQRIAIENVSYYAAPGQEMAEIDFFNAVVNEADCDILLDINNIYVNSVNHGYDAEEFLKAMPGHRSLTPILPGIMRKPRIFWSIPMARRSSTRSGSYWAKPMNCSASSPPCWNAISICRRWRSYYGSGYDQNHSEQLAHSTRKEAGLNDGSRFQSQAARIYPLHS